MNILLVAVDFYSSFGWSTAQALRRLGHVVEVFDYRKGLALRVPQISRLLIERMNRRLLEASRQFGPDLIFVEKGELVYPETLKQSKDEARCPLVNWFPDPRPMAYDHVMNGLPYYDFFFTKNPHWNRKLRAMGMDNVHYLPHAYDVDLQKRLTLSPGEKACYGAEVGFIGSMYPYRVKALEGIEDIDMKIWGPGWHTLPAGHPLRPFCQGRDLRGIDHSKAICASAINLNLHHYDDIEGVNQRFFDIAGCGGFQIVDERAEIARYLKPDEEVVCYRDLNELRAKIDYFRQHPDDREKIREKGFERIRQGNTYEDRLHELFARLRS